MKIKYVAASPCGDRDCGVRHSKVPRLELVWASKTSPKGKVEYQSDYSKNAQVEVSKIPEKVSSTGIAFATEK